MPTPETNLLPCPFCGSIPEILSETDFRITHAKDCYITFIGGGKSWQLFKSVWNTRTTPTQPSPANDLAGLIAVQPFHPFAKALSEEIVLRVHSWMESCATNSLAVAIEQIITRHAAELVRDKEILDELESMVFTNREGEKELNFDFRGKSIREVIKSRTAINSASKKQ